MYCLTDFCCICFSNKQLFKHLSDTDNDNITYCFKLTSCVPEMCFNKINDERLVCNKCCETMNTVYKFRQTCVRNMSIITDYISQLPTVSDMRGEVNVHLADIKRYHNENNIETNIEEIDLSTDIEKYHNETENSETRSEYSCKLNDNNYFKMKNIKIENEDSEKYAEDSFERCLENRDDFKIDIVENDIKLTINEIKKENENEDREYLDKRYEDPLMNLGEVNMESKNEKFLKEYRVHALDPISCHETMKETPKSSASNKISKLQVRKISNIESKKLTHTINTAKKSHECSVCKKKLSRAHVLKIHMRIHTGEKPYECSICKKKFKQTGKLKIHMRIHTGEKPYECLVCKNKFSRTGDLNIHMRTHTGENPYACGVCKNKFNHSHHLKTHMRIHTGEKPHECNICNKKFKLPHNLKCHMKIHTVDKPYECSECNKKFKQQNDLKRHMRIHTVEKPYECSVCKKIFNQPNNLKHHMKVHTTEK